MKLRILLSFLPLALLIAAAVAETVVVDQWGTIVTQWSWPIGRTVIVPVYDPRKTLPPKGWPLQPNNYITTTPAPTPSATPRP